MSILYLAENKKRIHNYFISLIALSAVFTLIMATVFCGFARAGGIGDVVTEVANSNFTSTGFDFGNEDKTGYNFKMHIGGGQFGQGMGGVSVLGPVKGSEINILLDYVDSVAQHTSTQTTRMKGCEVREYTMENGCGIGVVLPDYFVTVEIYESGNSNANDFASAKRIAQETLDGMEQAGLLSQAAPDIESDKPAEKEESEAAQTQGAIVTGNPLDEPIRISETMNIAGVYNGPTAPTTFSISSPHLVIEILDYHWNDAKGANPGTIGLVDQNGKTYGPWQAVGTPGQGDVPNAYWHVYPNIVIPAGTYTVIDSDPATWSQNNSSGGKGMGYVNATPHFEITSGSIDDLTGNDKKSASGGYTESPAGVGAAGNIPGPSNTTEAIIGVTVPGLIATTLGALAGLGGGGGGFVPPTNGTPLYPTGGGGNLPGAGGTPGAGGGVPGMARATNQLGRRRSDEIYVPVNRGGNSFVTEINNPQASINNGILIDTQDMNEMPAISTISGDEVIIDTANEAGIFVQSQQGILIETVDEAGVFVQPESGIIIDTADMLEDSMRVQPEPGIIIDTDLMGSDLVIDTPHEGSFVIAPERSGSVTPEIIYSKDEEIIINTSALEDFDQVRGGSWEEETQIYDQNGFNQEGFDRDGFNREGFNAKGFDKDGFDRAGYDQEGFNREGFDKEGFNQAGFDKEGFNREGFNQAGFDKEGFNREGFNKAGLDREGYNKAGFNSEGYNREGFNQSGFDKEGFDKQGYNAEGFDKAGFDKAGFDKEGFDKTGLDREGYNKAGFNSEGYNREGFNQAGFDKEGFDKQGYNAEGFDKAGFDKAGFDQEGFDKTGLDREGYNKAGFNSEGYNREGFNQSGFDKEGFDKQGYNAEGFDKAGFDKTGFDQEGFDKTGLDREGYNKAGFNSEGYNREGFNQSGFNKEGFDKQGYNAEGFDKAGFDQEGFDKTGFNREGFNKEGFNAEGYDREGFNKAGFDKEGYGRNGFDSEGFDREGYDINGYNAKGYNRSGYNAEGYNAAGYDKEGFNKDGWDKEGYGRDGLNKQGFDREGYDKNGYDQEGYNRDGYNREGQSKEGYDADGYDKKGFNEHGYDRDGYDREGFNFEGYNRSGHDPWGYNKQGYGKDGYHWSGYNADGYDRSGRHWTDNPYEEGSIWNVDSYDPFAERVIDLGGRREAWEPTKPPLGEPYHRTVEKYGAKPWDDEIPTPTQEKPSIPSTENTGVIGPEDPMNTLKNHGLDKDAPTAPEGQAGTGLPIPEEDIPDVGNIAQDTTSDIPPVTGPQNGDTITLPGKDGRDYPLEYNSQTGEWENLLTGGKIRNEDLESYVEDFNRWQNDVAEDKRQVAIDLEKMARREDATSKAIDKNLDDWRKLEQMQRAADKYNIGEPGGPGDVDKAIQNLKDDMLAGKQLDQEKMDKVRQVIDNRILGKTSADTGERWNEDWFKNLGWALEANAATAKEVITGEKADGSTSWLGMSARVMINVSTGGAAGTLIDGGFTVAEAMYRIKDSIDKGESDFVAVSKAIGMTVLGEEMGYLAGAAGGQIMGEMMERFPAFTNKTADLIETAVLKVSAKDQIWSKSLGLISKESAEESLDQINKRLVDIGSDEAAQGIIKNARTNYGLSVADSFDDVTKVGKTVTASRDDIFKGTGKSASEGWSDIAEGRGKSVSTSSDDLAKGGRTAAAGGDGPEGPTRGGAGGADGPGDPGRPPSGRGDDVAGLPEGNRDNLTLNRGARTPEEVVSDPVAVNRAERTVQDSIKDFDKLPPTRQQELVREQAIYDEYRLQAQERTWNVADKVQRGEPLTVEDIMEMKSDPASMRTLKNLREMDGLGSQLTQQEAEGIQRQFNNTMDEYVHQPSYRTVEDHLHNRYPGADPEGIRCRTVRTPGTEPTDFNINTDNDVIAERLVHGPHGPEWVEIPKSEWEDTYYKAFAENSGFSVDEASRRFPQTDWANMDDAARFQQWAKHHEEAAMDQFDISAGRDFSNQRTWRIDDGGQAGRPMIEATPDEIARGVETVNIDGKEMRPSTGYELVQKGQGNLLDSEQLSLMESHKVDDYWNAGSTPAEVMRNQTEAMEQLRKTASVAQTVESSYRGMGYKIEQMPDNMQEAIKVINNNNLSPAARGARLQELGYESPGDFLNKVSSRIGAIRTATRK